MVKAGFTLLGLALSIGSAAAMDHTFAAAACDSGFAAYQTTVFPFVRARCIACHDSPATGPVQGPPHSVSDPAASYRMMLEYLDSDQLDHSRLVTTGGNGHCKSYGVDCGTTVADILPVVMQWWTGGQSTCTAQYGNVTAPLMLPPGLPTRDKGFRVLEIPPGSLGAAFQEAKIRVEFQVFSERQPGTSPGAYRLRTPRLIITGNQSIHVKGLRIFQNGKWDPKGSELLSVDQVVNAKTEAYRNATGDRSAAPLSTNAVILIQDKGPGDTISLGFDVIEAVDARHCRAPDVFMNKVMPVVERRACLECHGSGAKDFPKAKSAFYMPDATADLCDEFLVRSTGGSPLSSQIIRYGTGQSGNHLPTIPTSADVLPLVDWIRAESK